jgi:hypothetical protein
MMKAVPLLQMSEITNIKLKFSCSENWDTMPDAEGGKHCDKCQKKVYDFTNSKADEFRQIMAENNNQVCGHFSSEQLVRKYPTLNFWRRWMPAAVVFTGLTLFACNQPKKKVYITTGIILVQPPDSLKIDHKQSRVECTNPTTPHKNIAPKPIKNS